MPKEPSSSLSGVASKNMLRRKFNVLGHCNAQTDYMVDISEKIAQIVQMVRVGKYFTINRARQYGKTTTLSLLGQALRNDYLIARISFQGVGANMFASEANFCQAFIELVHSALAVVADDSGYAESWLNGEVTDFLALGKHITTRCRGHELVLMIDEVDQVSNNRVFLDFLGMLREKYLQRIDGTGKTFHSVILAGVHDVKNIKVRMVSTGRHVLNEGEGYYNSPWNIAADFRVDMSFSLREIATMLQEYEQDNHTGMDITSIAAEIHDFSNGYPYLVSRICQCIDEELHRDWTICGVKEAVKHIVQESSTLFDDIVKNLENHTELYNFIYDILIRGVSFPFVSSDPINDLAMVYGLIEKKVDRVAISNRMFAMRICEYFIAKDLRLDSPKSSGVLAIDIVKNGRFNMELCLQRFAQHYRELHAQRDGGFLERHNRLIFLSYLRPLINGRGFYHLESELADLRRMDIVVDFAAEQFIIELKNWHGSIEHNNAYNQLLGYMETKNATIGYLLTFDFRSETSQPAKAEWIEIEGRRIFDVIC